MTLDSHQLRAFEFVARLGSYSAAATALGLTQPALSRRIQGLELSLGQQVFLRTHGGVELTAAGTRLLSYVQTKDSLEGELIAELNGPAGTKEYVGTIRVAGYSTVLNHVIAPALAPFLRENPRVHLHFTATQGVRPSRKVFTLLERAEVDFVVLHRRPETPGLTSHLIGHQELVAVESTKYSGRETTFLDTRPEDDTTTEFFAKQSAKLKVEERTYLHDEDGILNGVLMGLGRAVILSRVMPKGAALRRVKGLVSVKSPLYLHFRQTPFRTKLLIKAAELLEQRAKAFLN